MTADELAAIRARYGSTYYCGPADAVTDVMALLAALEAAQGEVVRARELLRRAEDFFWRPDYDHREGRPFWADVRAFLDGDPR